MGQSVLTPEEDLLGKVGEPACVAWFYGCVSLVGVTHSALGEREFGPRFRNRLVGNARASKTRHEAVKQLTTAGRQGSLAWGELSFLFDVAEALNVISGGERLLNTQGKQRAFLRCSRCLDYPYESPA